MIVICFDLEGVFFPEIWINVAEKTKIDEHICFSWHFGCHSNGQRILNRRMSGLEICRFIVPHMYAILASGLFDKNASAKKEFQKILNKIVFSSDTEFINNHKLYKDKDHLNMEGARLFSMALAKEIQKNL